MSKEDFKSFVRENPSFNKYVASGQMSWQKFYEMYDLYGKDNNVWDEYRSNSTSNTTGTVNKINDLIKNVDMDSIKEHINTAQKALDFVQELTSKTPSPVSKPVVDPRPLNKFFED